MKLLSIENKLITPFLRMSHNFSIKIEVEHDRIYILATDENNPEPRRMKESWPMNAEGANAAATAYAKELIRIGEFLIDGAKGVLDID